MVIKTISKEENICVRNFMPFIFPDDIPKNLSCRVLDQAFPKKLLQNSKWSH